MKSLVKGALILGFARLTNYAVLLLSPLLLVRILDVESYGQYREFLLYSAVLISVLGLAIKDNLIYIVPKHPDRAAIAASHTANMLLVMTLAGLGIFLLGQQWFMARASFDFALLLALYVLFFLSHDILENYWLGKQQPGYVLIYSTIRSVFRLTVVVLVAYFTRDVSDLLVAIVAAEFVRWSISFVIMWRLRLLPIRLDRPLLREQLRFIAPLSAAGLIYFVNEKAGHLFVSATLGAGALAIYTIGTYQLPVMAVVRSAVADTLFPEMVRRSQSESAKGLALWKVATVGYVFLAVPIVVVLMYYAELFITTLFTDAYIEAVDVFRFALIIMLRQCFEMGTPLRAINANKPMLQGNLLAMLVHLPLLYYLVQHLGIAGAALAWVVADMLAAAYMAKSIMRKYEVSVESFARWGSIARIGAAALLASPLLFLVGSLEVHEIIQAAIGATSYGIAYLVIVAILRVAELTPLYSALRKLILRTA